MSARIVPDYRELANWLTTERAAGRRIALTNGCFDLLHVGHIRLLQAAAAEADCLVVALNSDASIRANKGAGRPLVPLVERMEVLAALACVDFVTSFEEATADDLLACLRPEVHCKGTDWTVDRVPERATVEAYGGRIAICGDPKTHSSSELASRIDPT
ncbi:MAG: adenylyltransferase/cytidyltransferase family protein [Planctomycetes bacterium]|nr:adenylyltransferase/cytidyltransferase family protein [Planctomycetota bacterium]MCB9909002.1 adenylyltransferase/cytidyltransferase family protein [Planctomycetota bacterium]MCB9911753.1 adenylyltransferase/cytidyltransferase family protein [Planctomycetota bacterium]HPF15425.1 adenylyltransferase/cytidyltransferase family protein [Planctomycetota bacterium]HRV80011.1 adenylyltransferase/cytidyltransferase family protein [Planctomycetota bacterium]